MELCTDAPPDTDELYGGVVAGQDLGLTVEG